MTEHVSRPYKLPPEVLKLLGDDATPERLIKHFSEHAEVCLERVEYEHQKSFKAFAAHDAWDYTLAASAIRAKEAAIAFFNTADTAPDKTAKWQALRDADADYMALRNWRKT